MNQKEHLLSQYQKGSLTPKENEALEQFIERGLITLEELENYVQVQEHLYEFEEMMMPEDMDTRFHTMLSKHIVSTENKGWRWSSFLTASMRWAVPVIAVVISSWAGMKYGQSHSNLEIPNKNIDLATSLLTTEDISEKIHLVSNTKLNNGTQNKVIVALLFTLNNDESTNVRLACIDVLENYSHLPKVREGLINAIVSQSSPIVLTNLAEAINSSGKRIDQEEFRSRINKDLPPPVKANLERQLILL